MGLRGPKLLGLIHPIQIMKYDCWGWNVSAWPLVARDLLHRPAIITVIAMMMILISSIIIITIGSSIIITISIVIIMIGPSGP